MSGLTFKVFCIENYANHKAMNSADVHAMFDNTGLLQLLDTDYEDLHGMGTEYLIQLIENEYSVEENTALKMFYNSQVGKLFSVDDCGLYGQSANYIFSLVQMEIKG